MPKESKDSATSLVRQRKINRDTSHVMQGMIIFGDDITESTVLTKVTKGIIPIPNKAILNLVTFLYD